MKHCNKANEHTSICNIIDGSATPSCLTSPKPLLLYIKSSALLQFLTFIKHFINKKHQESNLTRLYHEHIN